MSVSFGTHHVAIDGICGIEDAMPLLEFLQADGAAEIDLRACTHVHSAALQVLMAAAEHIIALPEEAFLARWLQPLFAARVVNAAASADAPASDTAMLESMP